MEVFRLETSSEVNPKSTAWKWDEAADQNLAWLTSVVVSRRVLTSQAINSSNLKLALILSGLELGRVREDAG